MRSHRTIASTISVEWTGKVNSIHIWNCQTGMIDCDGEKTYRMKQTYIYLYQSVLQICLIY